MDKGNIINTNSSGGALGMILTEANGGTRLSSTRYVHYGTITARSKYPHVIFSPFADESMYTVKTGRWAGVVTAFITMSNIKDEIDWECGFFISIFTYSRAQRFLSPRSPDHRGPVELFLAGRHS